MAAAVKRTRSSDDASTSDPAAGVAGAGEAGERRAALGDISNVAGAAGGLGGVKAGLKGPTTRAAARAKLQRVDEAGSLPAPKLIEHKDIDVAHADNPQYCVPYVHDIYAHLRETEKVRRPNMRYLEDGTQSDINSQMRSILVDWLVEVAEEYKLVSDTLYLSVNYIDRVLSSMPVQRSRLQLVGVSCMLVAAKYEEIYAPQVDEFVYITDNTYTRNEVIQMERKILDLLGFELTAPTGKHFLRRFIQSSEPDGKTELLANYLCELTLVEAKFLQYLPSKVAAACVFLANFTMKRQPWNSTIEHYTGYTLGEIAPVVAELHKLYKDSPKSNLVAIREKYAATKFKSVSTIVPPEHLHGLDLA